MKKIVLMVLMGLLLSFLFIAAQVKAQDYPAGIISTSPLNLDMAGVGAQQTFPGGKAKSTHCATDGYESFPAGYFYAASQNVFDTLSDNNSAFMKQHPDAFTCNGSVRYLFGGGTLVTDSSSNSSMTVTPTVAGTDKKDVDLKWSAVSGASTYKVERGSTELKKDLKTTEYTDKDPPNGTYIYTITAYDSAGKVLKTGISGAVTKTDSEIKIATASVASDPDAPDWTDIVFPPTKITSIPDLIVRIGNWLLSVVGVLAVLAIVYSGIMYITSSGDQTKAEAAKKNLTWAIMGLLVILLSLVIVNSVGTLLLRGSL